jgi:HEPN domain-containing protein
MANEEKIKETQAWLEKAKQDLKSAKWLLSSPEPLYNAVGFHSQQAAEKLLKAYLTWHDEPFEKTHSLVALVGKGLQFDQDLQELRLASVTLTPFAVTFRYPGELPELTLDEANKAYVLAEEMWHFLIERFPKETHPE